MINTPLYPLEQIVKHIYFLSKDKWYFIADDVLEKFCCPKCLQFVYLFAKILIFRKKSVVYHQQFLICKLFPISFKAMASYIKAGIQYHLLFSHPCREVHKEWIAGNYTWLCTFSTNSVCNVARTLLLCLLIRWL